jgi:hypothetical protein
MNACFYRFKTLHLTKRHFLEHIALPAINIVDYRLPLQPVVAKLGEDDSPHYPVQTTSSDDGKADNAVKVVGKSLVNAVVVARRDKWRDDQIDVAEHEEDRDGKRGPHRWVPVVLFLVQVNPSKTGRNKDVDNSKRVRDDAAAG